MRLCFYCNRKKCLMSVPKSERRQSNVEYIVILQQMEQFFLEANTDEKNRVPYLSDELVKLSIQSYNAATKYFETTNGIIKGTLAQRKKYCTQAMWSLRELAAQINILIAIRMNLNKSVKGLVLKTNDLLKAFELLQEQLKKLNHEKE